MILIIINGISEKIAYCKTDISYIKQILLINIFPNKYK